MSSPHGFASREGKGSTINQLGVWRGNFFSNPPNDTLKKASDGWEKKKRVKKPSSPGKKQAPRCQGEKSKFKISA